MTVTSRPLLYLEKNLCPPVDGQRSQVVHKLRIFTEVAFNILIRKLFFGGNFGKIVLHSKFLSVWR